MPLVLLGAGSPASHCPRAGHTCRFLSTSGRPPSKWNPLYLAFARKGSGTLINNAATRTPPRGTSLQLPPQDSECGGNVGLHLQKRTHRVRPLPEASGHRTDGEPRWLQT
jgi:hypothetical protein